MRRAVTFSARCLALAGLVLLVTGRAQASSNVPFSLDVYADGSLIGQADQSRLGCTDNPDGVSAHCFVQDLPYGAEYPLINIDEVNIDIDSDPIVTGVTTVTNLLGVTQHFKLVFTLPISPIPGSTLTGGSVRGTVTDRDGDGATVSTILATSLYTAQIDGADWQQLYAHSSSFSAGSYLSASIPTISFGSPIPSLPGPAALTSIGIVLEFDLTPFDSASFTSNHVVQAPEPQTAALLALGLTVLAAKKRRNQQN